MLNFKKMLDDSAKALADGGKKLAENVKNTDLDEFGNQAASTFGNLAKSAGDLGNQVAKSAGSLAKGAGDFLNTLNPETIKAWEEEKKKQEHRAASINMLEMIYLMVHVDGQIDRAEQAKLDEIGLQMMEDYPTAKEEVLKECNQILKEEATLEAMYDVVLSSMNRVLEKAKGMENGLFAPKLLVWDLLMIACSDGSFDENERRLLMYIAHSLGVDKDTILEMEDHYLTLVDLDREKEWLKSTNRSYLEIEKQLTQIKKRSDDVQNHIKTLIEG